MYRGIQSGMSRFMGFFIPVLGLLLILACAGLIWWWESNGREQYFYEEVIVLNQDVKRGQVIDSSMLSYAKFESTKIIQNAIRHKEDILQKAALHFIPKHTQLVPQYFGSKDIMTVDGKMMIKIPNEWIFSVPNTIRRNDVVYFYEVKKDVLDVNKTDVSGVKTHSREEEITLRETFSNSLLKATVAYVKDSANREVVSVSEEDRLDGSSVVKDIEVPLSLQELQMLENAVRNGSKFILMYEEGAEAL